MNRSLFRESVNAKVKELTRMIESLEKERSRLHELSYRNDNPPKIPASSRPEKERQSYGGMSKQEFYDMLQRLYSAENGDVIKTGWPAGKMEKFEDEACSKNDDFCYYVTFNSANGEITVGDSSDV